MSQVFARIRAPTWARLRDLQQVYDLDVFGPTARHVGGETFEIQGLVSAAQIATLRADGYQVDEVADADQVARERLREAGDAARPPP